MSRRKAGPCSVLRRARRMRPISRATSIAGYPQRHCLGCQPHRAGVRSGHEQHHDADDPHTGRHDHGVQPGGGLAVRDHAADDAEDAERQRHVGAHVQDIGDRGDGLARSEDHVAHGHQQRARRQQDPAEPRLGSVPRHPQEHRPGRRDAHSVEHNALSDGGEEEVDSDDYDDGAGEGDAERSAVMGACSLSDHGVPP